MWNRLPQNIRKSAGEKDSILGKIFYVMGKSAAGKDTVYRELLCRIPELKRIVPFTTRPMREHEREGREYHFLTEAALTQYQRQGRLIEQRVYQTTRGRWIYATVDDGSIDPGRQSSYLGIGTLESFQALCRYFGRERMMPLYLEVPDGERLRRAIQREEKQQNPRYDELCRRYLADEQDFSDLRLKEAGIRKHYDNTDLESCLADLIGDVIEYV